MRALALVLAMAVAPSAWAVPMTMTQSGRVLDAAGSPINGTHTITVNLYDDLGVSVWGDTFENVPVAAGYYAVVLGSEVPLTTEALAGDAIYVGVQLAGHDEVVSDTPMGSVPFAVRTEEARNLKGGTVEATTIEGTSLLVDSVVATGDVTSTTLTTGGITASGDISTTGSITASGDLTASGVVADDVLATAIDGETITASGAMSADSLEVTSLVAGTIEASSVLVDGQAFGGPIVGEWYPTDHFNNSSGTYQFMTFNAERFNTDSSADYFTWNGSNTITFSQPGYYRVDLRSISYNSNGDGNHFETWKNGARLHLSHSMSANTSWRRHATSVVSYFAEGDTLQVRVYCRTNGTHCYHSGPDYTALTVQYMR